MYTKRVDIKLLDNVSNGFFAPPGATYLIHFTSPHFEISVHFTLPPHSTTDDVSSTVNKLTSIWISTGTRTLIYTRVTTIAERLAVVSGTCRI